MDANLEQSWHRLERMTIVPGVTGASILADGASVEHLREFETALGLVLPTEVRESFVRHNGQRAGSGYYAFQGANFLSLEEVLSERSRRVEAATKIFGPLNSPSRLRPSAVDGPVQREYWVNEWIPVLKRNKEPICADLRPAPGGAIGQLIVVDWEGGTVSVIASSLADFLNRCGRADA